MKIYNSYKDSGIEWISEIPEHWQITKIKNISSIIGRIGFRGYTVADIVEKGNGAISLSPSNIKNQTLEIKECTYISWDKYFESPEIMIKPNDIIVVKTGSTIGKTAIIPDKTPEMTLNPQLIVLKNIKINPRFLYYTMVSKYFQSYYTVYSAGGSTPAISQEKINNFRLMHPSSDEQVIITNYLDKKTIEIDALVAKKKRLISLIKEERTAIINHAVTKGIDSNVKFKDSGIDWIGEMPKHWEVKKLKYVADCNLDSLSEKTNPNERIKYIEIGDVSHDAGIMGYTEYNFGDAPSRARRIVNENDIIISTVRTYLKAIALINKSFDNFIVSTGFAVITPFAVNSQFLSYMVLTEGFIDEVISRSKGVSYPSITTQELLDIKICIPKTTEEQIQIAEYLKTKTSELEKIISKTEKEIELMQEYKTALISEVVTGKVDVRDEVLV